MNPSPKPFIYRIPWQFRENLLELAFTDPLRPGSVRRETVYIGVRIWIEPQKGWYCVWQEGQYRDTELKINLYSSAIFSRLPEEGFHLALIPKQPFLRALEGELR